MPWDILDSTAQTTSQELVPGDYGALTPVTVDDAIAGDVLIAADASRKAGFINFNVEPKLTASGQKIIVYCGVGFTPTSDNYSYAWRSGHQESNFLVNGQEYRVLAQTGQSIKMNVQLAPVVKV